MAHDKFLLRFAVLTRSSAYQSAHTTLPTSASYKARAHVHARRFKVPDQINIPYMWYNLRKGVTALLFAGETLICVGLLLKPRKFGHRQTGV